MQIWINLLTLIPSTLVTVLVITIAFLRFYDQNDFELLGFVTDPRVWSNRLTVAALLAAMASGGVEWYRRNRETDRLAQEKHRRAEEEQRRAEEEQRRAEEAQRRDEEVQRRNEEVQRRMDQERAEKARRAEEEHRRAEEEHRRAEEVQHRVVEQRAENDRRAEERERSARRDRIQTRCYIAQIKYQLDPSEVHRQALNAMLAVLEEYGMM